MIHGIEKIDERGTIEAARERCILIVEDDPELLAILSRRFSRQGYAVTAARHPRQALAAASQHRFEVAVLDYTLPEYNGVQLMEKLQGLVAGLQVILLSGRSERVIQQEATDHGACAYFRKPCRLADLESAIEVACG